ncbi:MAG TPA: Gfo/Idh/MocA family oxidoreductase [Verrucomicrobiae bacterium]
MKSQHVHTQSLNRRRFLQTTSLAAGAMVFGVPALLRGQNLNSKLNIAAIGATGKGQSDTDHCASENIVALCDVDADRAGGQRQKYPQAKFYQDYRRMFDEMEKGIDAVTVSTPDHMHAIIASLAMQHGKHVYCQKPLVQTIYEARYLQKLAQKKKIITQMGNQGSSADGLRRAVECIQAGIIGQVREVHIWTNRPIWPQGGQRPEGSDPVPAGLNWDLWLGCAAERPYKSGVYAPFNWRGWLDFGTGALGDMACHTVNMPFRALNLDYPTEIEAITSVMPKEMYPIESKIHFTFPQRKTKVASGQTLAQDPVTLTWYDGGKPEDGGRGGHDNSNKPPKELLADIEAMLGEVPNSACLIIGDKGKIFSPDDYGEQFFIKQDGDAKLVHYKKHAAAAEDKIPVTIPRNTFKGDADHRQHLEWIDAIKQGKPELCYSRFDIGAKLTEIMLLGCVSLRVGKKIEWDGPNMKALNCPEAAPFIKRENRAGWKLS